MQQSFYREDYTFASRSFSNASLDKQMEKFVETDALYEFHYASMLRLAFCLRKWGFSEEGLKEYLDWYFSETLLSIYGITYVVLCYCGKVQPPHHYTDELRVVEGCKNEAFDLRYLQILNSDIQPYDFNYNMYLATKDKDMACILQVAMQANMMNSEEEMIRYLFSYYKRKGRESVIEYVIMLFRKHRLISVTKYNAVQKGKTLAEIEEKRLISSLG